MGSFRVFTRHVRCYICGKYGDCKEVKDTGTVLCMKSHAQEDAPDGWRFIGPTKGEGLWGQFVRSDSGFARNVTPLPRRKEPPKVKLYGLSHTQLLIENQKISNQLALQDDHRAWLLDRANGDSAFVDWLHAKSYGADTLLDDINPTHPSLDWKNKRKLRLVSDNTQENYQGGLLLPMPWRDGYVSGWQVVPQERIDCFTSGQKYPDGAQKYKWLPGSQLPRPYESPPHGLFIPPGVSPDSKGTLHMMEGALKGALSAWLLQVPVLATGAGGAFNSNQVAEVVNALGIQRVIFYPDAGMHFNTGSIPYAYHNNVLMLEAMRLPVLFAWWGQFDKAAGDVDDHLLSGQPFQPTLISYDEYFDEYPDDTKRKIDKARARRSLMMVARQEPIQKFQPEDPPAYRDHLRHRFSNELRAALLGELPPGKLHVFRYPVGTGKSTGLTRILKELKAAQRQGVRKLPGRVLVLVRTKKEARELADSMGTSAMLFEGRTSDNRSQGHCIEFPAFNALASNRHNAFDLKCQECYESLQMRHWGCPFRDQDKKLRGSDIVIGCYSSFINESERLDDFQTIIIDEAIDQANVVETVTVQHGDVEALFERINKRFAGLYPEDSKVLAVIQEVQKLLAIANTLRGTDTVMDARTYWQADIHGAFLEQWPEGGPGEAFPFELPGDGILPKRFLVDLLGALANGKQVDLTADGLIFSRTFLGLTLLKSKAVLNLDATPLLDLLRDVWGADNVEVHGPDQPIANIEITQCLGKLDRAMDLKHDPKRLRDIETIIRHYIKRYDLKAPLIVAPKVLCRQSYANKLADPPGDEYLLDVPPGAALIWWGGPTRASNDFIGCDAVFCVANYEEPPPSIRRKVNAIRQSPIPTVNPAGDPLKIVKPMAQIGDSDLIPGRRQHDDPDWLLQSVIDGRATAEIIQVAGRPRPLDKPQPVPVFILNDRIYPGLPVDRVEYQRDIIKAERPEYLGTERPHLREMKTEQTQEVIRRGVKYLTQNPAASLNDMVRDLGGSKSTWSKYRKALLELVAGGTLMAENNIYKSSISVPAETAIYHIDNQRVSSRLNCSPKQPDGETVSDERAAGEG